MQATKAVANHYAHPVPGRRMQEYLSIASNQ